ncbi:MAG: nucleotide sugar dehydrogenase [Lentisphaeria bacterium]|nr:nucleotide sugar dehydrogenase [Lentisphaeria bacterium]
MKKKIVIVGGCGHVGIPLGLAFASRGMDVTLLDRDSGHVKMINNGTLPFKEEGGEEILLKHLNRDLRATVDPEAVHTADVVVFVVGTPVDEHLSPKVRNVLQVIEEYLPCISDDQLIVMRSTLFPGTMQIIGKLLADRGIRAKLAFCPERILQGKGIEEIFQLPQIVSGLSGDAEDAAAELFSSLTDKVIRTSCMEAELAKLMTNSWRYLEFAIANQFYMMASDSGVDFNNVYAAMTADYPRAKSFARPGLAAGPCLFKDTMQLASFYHNNFFLGHAAMLINEGLPDHLVKNLKQKMGGSLCNKKIAILGMTFKADNDDIRESLAFKVKKLLEIEMAQVIPSDPYLPDTVPLEQALAEADGIILGVPHREYRDIVPAVPSEDCWGCWVR